MSGLSLCVEVVPIRFFKRFQASIKTIRDWILHRLNNSRWPKVISHTRQGHWLRSLYRKTLAYFGQRGKDRLLEGFDYLIRMDEIPVSRRIKPGPVLIDTPYRRVSLSRDSIRDSNTGQRIEGGRSMNEEKTESDHTPVRSNSRSYRRHGD